MDISVLLVGWGWTYDQLKSGWQEIEALGYDACYVGDDMFVHHMEQGDSPPEDAAESVFEPWTILAAMAATTNRMRIGSLVSPSGRRHPALFAKMTTMVDIISGGRLSLGMGAGNSPDQFRTMGIPFGTARERTDMLEEELEIINTLWTEGRATFQGKYYNVLEAINSPKPIQKPHPEIHIAFKNPKYLPPIAAKYADRVNLMGKNNEDITKAVNALNSHCQNQGRDFERINKGRLASIIFTESEVGQKDRQDVIRGRAVEIGVDADELIDEHEKYVASYVGPASGCAEALAKETVELGLNEVVMCIDTFTFSTYERTMEGLRTFAIEVMPKLSPL
jgi:alkanesulfonate monooxygenase SsuD/methylene tetrahydromethanopterin reductase-like flavin-dependent oxidoreductase (luciferase family)